MSRGYLLPLVYPYIPGLLIKYVGTACTGDSADDKRRDLLFL
jgi:hypothetical protein